MHTPDVETPLIPMKYMVTKWILWIDMKKRPTILITTHLTVTTFSGQMIHFLFELVLKNWLSCNPTANKMNSKIVVQGPTPRPNLHSSQHLLSDSQTSVDAN